MREQIEATAAAVYASMPASPQISWPLLNARTGAEVWLKHENHNPTGSFKVRGGLIYLARLLERENNIKGVIAATRGNYGQSVAFACAKAGLKSVVVVPEGNSEDKNKAMLALGAELIIAGADFDESIQIATQLSVERQLHLMPSFHTDLVEGVASYGLELLQAQPDIERVYVPIGLGSGICGVALARNALGLDTEIIGVVSENANAYQLSLTAKKVVPTNSAVTLADGLAVRTPNKQALEIILANVSRIVSVSDTEVLHAMKSLFEDTHNVVEGAGAAPTAALLKEAGLNAGAKVAAIVTGANVEKELFTRALMS